MSQNMTTVTDDVSSSSATTLEKETITEILSNTTTIAEEAEATEATEVKVEAEVETEPEIVPTAVAPAAATATANVSEITEPMSGLTVSDNGDEEVATSDEKIDDENVENDDNVINDLCNHASPLGSVPDTHKSIGKRIRRTSEKLQEDTTKKYSRDQLLLLKDSTIGREKPTTIPDVCKSIIRHSSNNQFNSNRIYQHQEISLLPTFMKGLGNMGNSGNSTRPYKGRSSQKANSDDAESNKIIKVSLNINEEVKLKESANAWRPRHLQKMDNVNEEDKVTAELFRKFRSVLNKLTPENFSVLVEQVKAYTIDTTDRLDGCIKIVFEKAISEPNFTETYAQMCKEIGKVIRIDIDDDRTSTFKRKIVSQCQSEFEKHREDKEQNTNLLDENQLRDAEEDADAIKLQLEEQDLKIRRRALGTIRFIAELYRHDQLTPKIMNTCITILLGEQMLDEESLECLCKLLTTIGDKMDNEHKQDLTYCFQKLEEIYDRKSTIQVSNRIRFMIQDLIELRRTKWQPRRVVLVQKTMDEIQKEAEAEENKNRMLNYHLPQQRKSDYDNNMGYSNNNNHMNDGGAKNRRFVDDDGFVQPTSSRNSRGVPIFDPKKIPSITQKAPEITKLGSASMYQGWSNNNNLYASLNDEAPANNSSFLGGNSSQSSSSSKNNSGGSSYGNKKSGNGKQSLYLGRKSSRF